MSGMCQAYMLCGLAGLALLPWAGRGAWRDWPYVLPFAGSWYAGMACLFGCFATVGALFGNILQSTRGLVSIGLAVVISRLGHVHLEARHGKGVFLHRAAAAALMLLAIVLYLLG
jgi:hypothetical protein